MFQKARGYLEALSLSHQLEKNMTNKTLTVRQQTQKITKISSKTTKELVRENNIV